MQDSRLISERVLLTGARNNRSWRRGAAWSAFWLSLLAVSLATDGTTMRWIQHARRAGSDSHRAPQSVTLNEFETYAKGYATVIIFFLIYLLDRRQRERAFALVLCVIVASVVCHVVKRVAGRERPRQSLLTIGDYATDFDSITDGLGDAEYQSFPSGHMVAAVTQSMVLTSFYPAGAPVFYGVAAAVGVERVYHGKHFPSDVLAGALLAWLVARWLLRSEWFGRLCVWLERTAAAMARILVSPAALRLPRCFRRPPKDSENGR